MRKNILVIVIDGCRADRLGAYGYNVRDTSPNIDALAQAGLTSRRSYSTSFCTMPAIVSAMTGIYPSVHKAAGTWSYYDGKCGFLPELLRGHGYDTFGVSNNIAAMSPEWGFVRGYERYYRVGKLDNWFKESKQEQRGVRKPSLNTRIKRKLFSSLNRVTPGAAASVKRAAQLSWYVDHDMGGAQAVEAFNLGLDERDSTKPFFAYLNIPETHHPFMTIKSFAETWGRLDLTENLLMLNLQQNKFELEGRDLTAEEIVTLQKMYDTCVRYSDFLLGKVVSTLRARNLLEDTAIAIIGDHGGNTWEHPGLFGSTSFTYEPEIRVPIILSNVGATGAIESLASLVDLFPTLVEVADLPSSNGNICHGKSLLSSSHGHREVLIDYPAYPPWLMAQLLSTPNALVRYGRTNRTMVTSDGQKLIWTSGGRHEHYDLKTDPCEKFNLFQTNATGLSLLARMQDAYESILGPAGRHLEIYPHSDVGADMRQIPPLETVNPTFDHGNVRFF